MSEEATPIEGAPAAPAAPVAPAAPTAPAGDPFDDTAITQFDRSYVEKLRKEAADHRTAAKPYKEVFDAYDDNDREIWFDLARTMAADPAAGAKKMLDLAQSLMDSGDVEGANKVIEQVEGEPKFLTKEELDAEFASREKAAKIDAETKAVIAEASELGYSENTAEYDDLMNRAIKYHNFDLKAAHAAREAAHQKVIDDFVASKGGPRVVVGSGNAPDLTTAPKTMAEAAAATRARLKAARQAQG